MADNVTFQHIPATPARGVVVAADEIGGILYQKMKVCQGNGVDVSIDAPFHVTDDYPYVLYYYDGSGNIEYKCSNSVHGTATSAETWIITKYAWGANGITSKQQLVGSVTGRAALGWV